MATHAPNQIAIPQGGGEMGERIRAFAWADTPLGPSDEWPQSLRSAVSILLPSKAQIVLFWGPELTALYNDAYRPVFGPKHPWALGRAGREVWSELWSFLGPVFDRIIETGEAFWGAGLPFFLEREDILEEWYFDVSYDPVRIEDGSVGGIFCIVSDQTGRILGDRRLRTLRELGARTAEAKTDEAVCREAAAALALDPADVPFAVLFLFDQTRERVHAAGYSGVAIADLSDGRELDVAGVPWLEGARDGRSTEVDPRVLLGGLPDVASGRALVLPISSGTQTVGVLVAGTSKFLRLAGGYRDFFDLAVGRISSALTNARAYQDEKRRAESLAELDRAKTRFFSNLSHEFRTPLTLMLGPAEEVLKAEATTPANRERVEVIQRNARRLLKLVNTLLEFSRIEAGRVEASFEPSDLAADTADLVSNFRAAVEKAGMRLVVDCPKLSEPVYADRDLWERVVLNLLSNAFKHTFEGTITVRLHTVDAHVELLVSDTGIGIAPEQLPHLFERFHRVPDARSRTHEGSGIGLALVQEIVRIHGGQVAVSSEPGVGTTFSVRLPLGTDHLPTDRIGALRQRASTAIGAAPFVEEALSWLPESEPSTTARARPVRSLAPDLNGAGVGGARILVADDNADMRRYVGRLMRERGWSVDAVADGASALERVIAAPPDVILADVMMPGLDGLALVDAVRADHRTRDIAVILVSARAGEEAAIEGRRAGADDYLVKPFSAEDLVARVESTLRRAAERRATNIARDAALAELRLVIEQAPVAMGVLRGPDHVFDVVNASYLRMVNRDRGIVGKPIREVFPEVEGQGAIQLFDSVLATGQPISNDEYRLFVDLDKDGVPEEYFYNYVFQPLKDADVGAYAIIFVAHDITAQVLARRAMESNAARLRATKDAAEQARRAAEEANRAKGEFLANMSHDLRTPLNAILGYAELVELGIHGPTTEGQRGALERIRHSGKHLMGLIGDVLSFAKIEAGAVRYEVAPVVMNDLIQSLQTLVEPQMRIRSLRYNWAGCAASIVARADGEKVKQILVNLLTNAIKFTAPGGQVTVRCASVGGIVRVMMQDTGAGIDPEKLERIFEPFVQLHRGLSNPTEGVGLGLAISREMARAMGGDITVLSSRGEGSTFTLTLPAI